MISKIWWIVPYSYIKVWQLIKRDGCRCTSFLTSALLISSYIEVPTPSASEYLEIRPLNRWSGKTSPNVLQLASWRDTDTLTEEAPRRIWWGGLQPSRATEKSAVPQTTSPCTSDLSNWENILCLSQPGCSKSYILFVRRLAEQKFMKIPMQGPLQPSCVQSWQKVEVNAQIIVIQIT